MDKSGMIRLRRKRQKSAEEVALKSVAIYFDRLIDFVTGKIVNDGYTLVSGDEKSIKIFSATFVLEPLKFESMSMKYECIVNDANIFYFLKKDDHFRSQVNLAKIEDRDFGKIRVDELVVILSFYDKLTDFISVGTRHTDKMSIEKVRPMIKEIFELPENLMEKFKHNQKIKLARNLMITGMMKNM